MTEKLLETDAPMRHLGKDGKAHDGKTIGRTAVQNWMDEALCREVGGDLWTPDDEQGSKGLTHRAIKVCGRCPVQITCLEHALEKGEMSGVWGGTTPTERKRLRRARRQIA